MQEQENQSIIGETFYLKKSKHISQNRRRMAMVFFTLGLCGLIGAACFVNSQSNYFHDGTALFAIDWSKETEQFYIQHFTSNKVVHPYGGSMQPGDGTGIVLHRGNLEYTKFTYIPVLDKPGFGLIKHVTSGKFLHPYGGSADPGDSNSIVIHSDYHFACLWSFQTS